MSFVATGGICDPPGTNIYVCCHAKRALRGLNALAFELGKIQKRCWSCFVQIRRYWTELIDEN